MNMNVTANKDKHQAPEDKPEMGVPAPAPRMPMPTPEVPDPENAHAPASPKELLTRAADDKLRDKADSLDDKAAEKDTDALLQEKLRQSPLKTKSKGERIHNAITYQGFDWIANAGFGVAFATWTERSKSGERIWGQNVRNKFFGKVLKPVFSSPEALKGGKTWAARFLAIMFGGTVTIPPIMWLEDQKNKRKIVESLDKKIYGEKAVENDPQFARIYHDIENEPEQGFAVGMVTRFAALAPILTAVLHAPTNAKLDKYLYTPIAKAARWTVGKVVPSMKEDGRIKQWMNKGGAKGEPFKPVVVDGAPSQNNKDFIYHTIGFDLGLSAIYAAMHEPLYKMTAAIMGNGKDKKAASKEDRQSTSDAPKHLTSGQSENTAYTQLTNAREAHQLADHTAMAEEAAETSATETLKRSVKTPERPGKQVRKIEAISRQEVRPEIAVN